MTIVRSEREQDRAAIRAVHESAFGQSLEADLVDALRGTDAYLPDLSLVACEGDRVVGHALFVRVALDSGVDVLLLAPVGVLPERQRQGVGGSLIREGLRRASRTDFPLVVVLGHAEYYPRFGFERARAYGIEPPAPVPDEAWMVCPLPAYDPSVRGRAVYPPAFEGL